MASTLIWFGFLTQMHERYAYGALVFLLLLIPDRRIQWVYLAFGIVFTLNLVSAVPPAPIFRTWLPYPGVHSLIGAIVMIGITAVVLLWTGRPGGKDVTARDHRVAASEGNASL